MSKYRIEIQVTIIALIIGAVLVTSGYYAYKSLSEIVFTIHKETRPDNRLFLMKDIANDLNALENNVRLYSLTSNKSDLKLYDTIQNNIIQSIQYLSELSIEDPTERMLTDSLAILSAEKLDLWNSVLNLHLSAEAKTPGFTELYTKLEEQKTDTITREVEVKQKGLIGNIFGGKKDTIPNNAEAEPKGLLKSIFGGKSTKVDTTIVEVPIQKDSIKQEIQNIETKIAEEDKRISRRETQLIEKNLVLTKKINQLITKSENIEKAALVTRTNEADLLAETTYTRLALFTIVAVILLLIALFVFLNYLRKSRSYQLALQKAKNEAENLAKAKEQFASNVSHEVRTPVNAIFGLAEQLLQQKTDYELKEQISVIAQSANHLRNIINDTLDFSKIQSNKLKIDAVHFSPEKVFKEVLNLEQNEANKKGIELNFESEGAIPDALVGDPVRLKQILLNLIGNSIKFTDEGNVTLMVKSIKKKYLMYHLEITISDTGIGIPKENINHIFEEFVQLENQSGKKFSGTGLGLSIVKKLVELQKGSIKVSSVENVGTEIKVSIPYPQGKVENIEELKFDLIRIPEIYKNLKVLIADDEEFNVFLMKAILKKWGISYKIVSDGNEVVDIAVKENFDFILMDIRMPGKSGIEATREILAQAPDTKIIAVTATNEDFDKEKCLDAGMKGFLLKPFSERELFDQFNNLTKLISDRKTSANNNQKINMKDAKHFANGDKAFLKEMSGLFLKSTNNGLDDIHKAIAVKDYTTIAEVCHKMAAPCKHFHATDLYNSIKLIEEEAKKNSDWAEINTNVKYLETEIMEVNKIIGEVLNL